MDVLHMFISISLNLFINVIPVIINVITILIDSFSFQVLQLIPENWSIGLVKQFLRHSVENNMHLARTRKIQNSLSRNENLQVKYQMMKQRREPVYLSEERLCQVCNRNFVEPKFVRYPNGVITHTHCARNKTICPVTGKLFSVTKET